VNATSLTDFCVPLCPGGHATIMRSARMDVTRCLTPQSGLAGTSRVGFRVAPKRVRNSDYIVGPGAAASCSCSRNTGSLSC
jgi:hypothetical protein